jgi:hypothetical protein
MSEAPKPNRKLLKATVAGGAGGALTLLFFLLDQRPELAQTLLDRVVVAWGPQFVIVLLLFAFLYLLTDRYAPRLIAAQSETALALQNLAGAVRQMVERDNSFQREQDVLLNHVARRVDALYRMVEQYHRTVNGHLNNLSRKKPRGLSRANAGGAQPREVKPKRTKSKRKTRNPRPVSS